MPTIDMTSEPIPQNSIDVDAVSGSFFAVRKSLYKELGGLDEDYFLHFEDLDLCRRVRGGGYRVVFNPEVSAVHVGAVSSGVKSVEIVRYKHQSLKTYFRKHLNRCSLTACTVSIMSQLYVWTRCLYELVNPEMRYNKDLDQLEGAWSAINVNEVFVMGEQCRLLHSVVKRLAARGYVVVVETNDSQTAPRIPRVSWVTSEYMTKVPEKDCPEFGLILCLGSTTRLKDYQQRFAHREFGSQLLIETGVEAKVADQNSTIEETVAVESGVDWLEWRPFSLQLRPNSANSRSAYTSGNNNKLVNSHDLKYEHQPLDDSHQQVHVDDISELCLDVLVGISEQKFDTSTQQLLNDCLDRFSRCIRPLYN